jgi:hypothetical protein
MRTTEGKIVGSKSRLMRSVALTAGAAWLAFVLPGAVPARADDNWWNNMLGFVGMGPKQPADDAIDYSARPALVVPPKMDLPPPQAALPKPADWPNDPDAAARRRAEADSRRPAPPAPPSSPDDASADDSDQSPQPAQPPPGKRTEATSWVGSSSAGLSGGGTSVFGGSSGALSAPNFDLSNWSLSNWNPFDKTDDTKAARTLRVGVEPPREYLTQPPPGYEAPVAVDTDTSTAVSSIRTAPAGPSAPLNDKDVLHPQ